MPNGGLLLRGLGGWEGTRALDLEAIWYHTFLKTHIYFRSRWLMRA